MYRSFFDVCSLTSEYVNSFDSAMVGSGGEVLVCVCVAEGCLCAVGSECVDSGRRRRIAEGGSTGVNWSSETARQECTEVAGRGCCSYTYDNNHNNNNY